MSAEPPPTLQLPNGTTVAHVSAGEAEFLYREIFTERCYLRRGIELRPGDVVFDVGANIGMFTLFAHLECPGVTVHAFEPAPVPYAALKANAERHGVAGRFDQCAVSDVAGRGKLTYYPDATVLSGFHPDRAARDQMARTLGVNEGYSLEEIDRMLAGLPDTSEIIDTPVVRLSDVLAERDVEAVGLLKIDVEKNERQVLRGVDEAHWPRIRQVVAEVHDIDGALDEVLTLLRGQGFTVVAEQEPLFLGSGIHQVAARRADA
jgi:31-O-methyltransferase